MITSSFEFRHVIAGGIPCVAVKRPNNDHWYIIKLESVKLAANDGCGVYPPGTLVCGYKKDEAMGFPVGFFKPSELWGICDSALRGLKFYGMGNIK